MNDLHIYDIAIIGGGPVGLNAALLADHQGYDFILLEGQSKLGGQLIELYPEKEILDLSGHQSILAKDYISWLLNRFTDDGKSRLLTHQKAQSIVTIDTQTLKITTDTDAFFAKYVIVASGLGVYMPRLLECHGAEGCRNIIYALHRLDFLKDKRVAIMGGGDAALDWARDISKHTPHVTLVHRRDQFRGNQAVIQGIKTLTIKKPYVPVTIDKKDDEATQIVIEHVDTKQQETLDVDYIFVNYGHMPVSSTFGLEKDGPGIKVNQAMDTSTPHVFAIGDVCHYQNKKRRIDVGIGEARQVFEKLKSRLGR